VRISQASFQGAVSKITRAMEKSGVRKKLTPKTAASLDELAKEVKAGNLTLSKAEELRRVIKQGQKSSDAADAGAAGRLLGKRDNFIEKLKATDLVDSSNNLLTRLLSRVAERHGIQLEITQYLKSARSLWSRARKTETIEELILRARDSLSQFSQSGFDNALRVQFRSLAKNKKQMRTFTQAEQTAIRKVARGGPLTNAFRNIGKLAPSGIVSGIGGAGAGFVVGGPFGAFAVPAIGGASKFIAARRTAKAAKDVSKLTRQGPQ